MKPLSLPLRRMLPLALAFGLLSFAPGAAQAKDPRFQPRLPNGPLPERRIPLAADLTLAESPNHVCLLRDDATIVKPAVVLKNIGGTTARTFTVEATITVRRGRLERSWQRRVHVAALAAGQSRTLRFARLDLRARADQVTVAYKADPVRDTGNDFVIDRGRVRELRENNNYLQQVCKRGDYFAR